MRLIGTTSSNEFLVSITSSVSSISMYSFSNLISTLFVPPISFFSFQYCVRILYGIIFDFVRIRYVQCPYNNFIVYVQYPYTIRTIKTPINKPKMVIDHLSETEVYVQICTYTILLSCFPSQN